MWSTEKLHFTSSQGRPTATFPSEHQKVHLTHPPHTHTFVPYRCDFPESCSRRPDPLGTKSCERFSRRGGTAGKRASAKPFSSCPTPRLFIISINFLNFRIKFKAPIHYTLRCARTERGFPHPEEEVLTEVLIGGGTVSKQKRSREVNPERSKLEETEIHTETKSDRKRREISVPPKWKDTSRQNRPAVVWFGFM